MFDGLGEQEWKATTREAVAKFKQGDIITEPGLFYVARPHFGIYSLTRRAGNLELDMDLLDLDPGDSAYPPYGIITTQTCDLFEQVIPGRAPKQPWIQVAPVYRMNDMLDLSQQKNLEHDRYHYLFMITATLEPPGMWACDLRIQFPLEKSCLVHRVPIQAFTDEARYIRFAEHLARRYGRPALANEVSDHVVNKLRSALDKLSPARKAELYPAIREFRLLVEPARLQVRTAQLIVITDSVPAPQIVMEWLDDWWTKRQLELQAESLVLLANRYETYENLTVPEYRRSFELDFRYLSPQEL